tara:strand:+ start:208 stop:645 length:438 start_codon:yes stop_codon:yes gene_type:complete
MSILDDLLESLDEPQAHLETENWIHEAPGDLVAGRIVAIGTNTTQYGEYQILTIKPETAQVNGAEMVLAESTEGVAVHMMGTVRANWMKENQPTVGGQVVVRYNGMVASKTAGNNPYADFSCNWMAPSAVDLLPKAAPTGGGMLG